MAINDVYRITDYQIMDGQRVLNVYYYVNTDVDGSAADLSTVWEAAMLSPIANVQSVALQHTRVDVEALGSTVDFIEHVLDTPVPGTLAGEHLPVWDAWGFKLSRNSKAVRNGAKRISGISEGSIANGEPISTIQDDLNALALAIKANLPGAGGAIYRPQIVGFNPDGSIRAKAGLLDVSFERVTTQGTRKPGRGA